MSTDLLYRVFTLKRIFRFTFLHQSFNRCSQAFSLFNLQGAIFLCLQRKIGPRVNLLRRFTKVPSASLSNGFSLFRRVFRTFQTLSFLGDSLFIISGSEPFVKNFFQLFSFSKSCSVPRRRSLRSSLFSISHTPPFVNTFLAKKEEICGLPNLRGGFYILLQFHADCQGYFHTKIPSAFCGSRRDSCTF